MQQLARPAHTIIQAATRSWSSLCVSDHISRKCLKFAKLASCRKGCKHGLRHPLHIRPRVFLHIMSSFRRSFRVNAPSSFLRRFTRFFMPTSFKSLSSKLDEGLRSRMASQDAFLLRGLASEGPASASSSESSKTGHICGMLTTSSRTAPHRHHTTLVGAWFLVQSSCGRVQGPSGRSHPFHRQLVCYCVSKLLREQNTPTNSSETNLPRRASTSSVRRLKEQILETPIIYASI